MSKNDRAHWLTTLTEVLDGSTSAQCPNCGQSRMGLRYIGDPETRIGYSMFWCANCLHGIRVSRAKAPKSVDFRSFDDSDALVGVPDFVAIN